MLNPASVPRDPQRAFGILLLAYILCVPFLLYLFWQIKRGSAFSKVGDISRKKNPLGFWSLIGIQLFITISILVGTLVNFINQFKATA